MRVAASSADMVLDWMVEESNEVRVMGGSLDSEGAARADAEVYQSNAFLLGFALGYISSAPFKAATALRTFSHTHSVFHVRVTLLHACTSSTHPCR
jgi:hypothetical protein